MNFLTGSLLVLASLLQAIPNDHLDQQDQPDFVAQLTATLARSTSGHSPTSDQILAVESQAGLKDGAKALMLLPLLERALTNPDAAVRQYALAMLVGVQALPESSKPETISAPSFEANVAKTLAPLVPLLIGRLTDDREENRELAATDLGGFAPVPPPSIAPALRLYLKRDDAIGAVGLALTSDLLAFGPLTQQTTSALIDYVRRPDQTAEFLTGLVERIAASPSQSKALNESLIPLIDSPAAGLRARLIFALPQLDLSADVFARLHEKVKEIAAVGSDQGDAVVAAARAIDNCWSQVRMVKGCPAQ